MMFSGKKASVLCCLLLLGVLQSGAEVESGKAYRIVPESSAGKSLFVNNASLDAGAAVVIWTETDVPAQQWYVEALPEGGYALRNVYSGLCLSVADGRVLQDVEEKPWQLDAVDAADNLYNIRYDDGQCLRITNTNDGQAPALGSVQTWRFEVVEAQTAFDEAARKRMIDGYLRQYVQDKGQGYRTFINGSWGEAETLETILDVYEATGDQRMLNIHESCYNYMKYHVGDNWDGGVAVSGYDWWGYNYNDDVMWLIIDAIRAYFLTGKQMYLNDAKRNFDLIWNRAYLGYVGLLRWAEYDGDPNGANSCVNGPAEVAACYIGLATGDETYFEKARELYTNQRQYLYEPGTGKVLDSVTFNPDDVSVTNRNTWASTYNQGTMLGGAILLYRHYGDEQYKKDAEKIISYARSALCNNHGIVRVCQNANGDFQGFKGILMRYAGLYVREFNDPVYQSWLMANAFHAYNNLNSKSFGHSAWLTKAAENLYFGDVNYGAPSSAFGGSTALSAACAVSLEDRIQPVATLEAEDARRSGNARVENGDDFGQYVTGLDNNGGQLRFIYDCPEAGRYLMDIYYLSAQSRNLQVTVGSKKQTVTCPSIGTWNHMGDAGRMTIMVDLSKGNNTITLNNPNGGAPNIDKITINTVLESGIDQAVVPIEEARADGDYTTFDYAAASDGHYALTVFYRTEDKRNMFLSVNDGDKISSVYAPTLGACHQRTLFVALHRGLNTLTFGNDNGAMPTIERIALTYLDRLPEDLEAEHAQLSGQVTVGSDTKASGGQYVSHVGGSNGNRITFRYDAPEAGDYELCVTYYTAQNRKMYVQVNNGQKQNSVYQGVSGWTDFVVGTVQLKSGTNTLLFCDDMNIAPYLDKISLKRNAVATDMSAPSAVSTPLVGDNGFYSLAGLRLSHPSSHGLYIHQGRKYIKK